MIKFERSSRVAISKPSIVADTPTSAASLMNFSNALFIANSLKKGCTAPQEGENRRAVLEGRVQRAQPSNNQSPTASFLIFMGFGYPRAWVARFPGTL
jgi:hypothetical protein